MKINIVRTECGSGDCIDCHCGWKQEVVKYGEDED